MTVLLIMLNLWPSVVQNALILERVENRSTRRNPSKHRRGQIRELDSHAIAYVQLTWFHTGEKYNTPDTNDSQ